MNIKIKKRDIEKERRETRAAPWLGHGLRKRQNEIIYVEDDDGEVGMDKNSVPVLDLLPA